MIVNKSTIGLPNVQQISSNTQGWRDLSVRTISCGGSISLHNVLPFCNVSDVALYGVMFCPLYNLLRHDTQELRGSPPATTDAFTDMRTAAWLKNLSWKDVRAALLLSSLDGPQECLCPDLATPQLFEFLQMSTPSSL